MLLKEKKKVVGYEIRDENEILGINTQADLARIRRLAKEAWFDVLMHEGVCIEEPSSTLIDLDVRIGKDVRIRPCTVIEGNTRIAPGRTIGPFAWIKNGKRRT
jgi:bifunctional UDP-N-acetylglucosamine pyrophosphorylase/glucosamine-1-phosphate N-acetyltransferase